MLRLRIKDLEAQEAEYLQILGLGYNPPAHGSGPPQLFAISVSTQHSLAFQAEVQENPDVVQAFTVESASSVMAIRTSQRLFYVLSVHCILLIIIFLVFTNA